MIPWVKVQHSRFVGWMQRNVHPWWPEWLCLRSWMFWVLLGVFLMGGLTSYLITRPYPWARFLWVAASYDEDAPPYRIRLEGEYEILRGCPEMLRAQAIWRAQVITAEGEVVTYVPGGFQPPLTEGIHPYSRSIQVETPPDGWRILFVAICPGEKPETVPSQLVLVHKRGEGRLREMP